LLRENVTFATTLLQKDSHAGPGSRACLT